MDLGPGTSAYIYIYMQIFRMEKTEIMREGRRMGGSKSGASRGLKEEPRTRPDRDGSGDFFFPLFFSPFHFGFFIKARQRQKSMGEDL